MPVEIVLWFNEEEIIANPDKIYVFGDNEARKGKGGQAKPCRDKPNTLGIRTKKTPGYMKDGTFPPHMYWHDDTYLKNVALVTEDFKKVEKLLKNGVTCVFPLDGFGTGLAELKRNAPRTLDFIDRCTKYLIQKYPKNTIDSHKTDV